MRNITGIELTYEKFNSKDAFYIVNFFIKEIIDSEKFKDISLEPHKKYYTHHFLKIISNLNFEHPLPIDNKSEIYRFLDELAYFDLEISEKIMSNSYSSKNNLSCSFDFHTLGININFQSSYLYKTLRIESYNVSHIGIVSTQEIRANKILNEFKNDFINNQKFNSAIFANFKYN